MFFPALALKTKAECVASRKKIQNPNFTGKFKLEKLATLFPLSHRVAERC